MFLEKIILVDDIVNLLQYFIFYLDFSSSLIVSIPNCLGFRGDDVEIWRKDEYSFQTNEGKLKGCDECIFTDHIMKCGFNLSAIKFILNETKNTLEI